MDEHSLHNSRHALEKQLATLREQVSDLAESLSAFGADAAEAARPGLNSASRNAREAIHTLRHQGSEVIGTVRDNPGTATSIAVTAGLLGLAIGYLAGSANSAPPPSKWRF